MSRAVLSMGSNLGDRRAHLGRAIATLANTVSTQLRSSSVYRTPPWGPVPQDDYLNIVVVAESPELDPYGWLQCCHDLEQAAGRVRDIRWGPRTLDVDVVVVDDVVSDDPDLILPHPRAHERAFVLLPWAEIEPDAELPGYGSIVDLLAAQKSADITLVGHVG